MQFKKDTYIVEDEKFSVEGEWLNGLPHGVCIVDNEYYRGVFTFTNGKWLGGPWWMEYKDTGFRESVEYFNNENKSRGLRRRYFPQNFMSNISSTS